ncbi:AbiH family protein [Bifidobacterium biavatii]|uniref:AbiH family protein n=1 Tax=Bifidobacterium biavatii TaxID=762212 RepID=UPI000AA69F4B|nr:AbiH family protein [Bifidobacterium biavatii]
MNTVSRIGSQIIILGNGFDKQCGVPSAFSDYFFDRFKSSEKFLSNLESKKNFDIHSLWNVFLASNKENGKNNWSDVEGTIRKWILSSEGLETIFQASTENVKPIAQHLKHLFDELQLSDKGKSGFPSFHPWPDACQDEKSYDESVRAFCNEWRFALLDEQDKFEKDFTSYMNKFLNEHTEKYNKSADYLFERIVNAGGCHEGSCLVISFNYTRPMSPGIDRLINEGDWCNVHGVLDQGNIIIGIDSDGLLGSTNLQSDDVIRFTKTYRLLTRQIRLHDYAPFTKVLDNGQNVTAIKFYGHSLSMSDYSYFKIIFDCVDLANSNVQLFFCHPDESKWFGSLLFPAIRLIGRYGDDLSDKRKGSNLLQWLMLENRIHFTPIDLENQPIISTSNEQEQIPS